MSTDNVPLLPLYNNALPVNSQATTRETSSEDQAEPAQSIRQYTRQQTMATPEERKKEDPERFFSIPKYQPTYTGGRSYNYEEKYAPDPSGERLSDNARVWKVYLDEAENYDDDMLKGFRDTIDSLLVFAALFSAVVTTFVIKTIEALEPDFGQATMILMMEQNQLLRSAGNATAINNIQPSPAGLDMASPSQNDLWVNGLFFASLSLSLATALISVLVKQWLQAYASMSSGNAKERAMIRQFRFSGFEKWGMQGIIGGLPLILHASLGLFLVGLALYVSQLHKSLCWIVVVITLLSFIIYFGSIILSLIWIECPYRIPILFMLLKFFLSPLTWHTRKHKTYSLKDTELLHLREEDSYRENYVQAQILDWLFSLESNKSIQRITAQALADVFQQHDFSSWHKHSILTIFMKVINLPLVAQIAWNNLKEMKDDENDSFRTWSSLITLWNQRMKDMPDGFDSIAKSNMQKLGNPSIHDVAYSGHLGVVKYLVEQGADVNTVGGLYGTALQAAASEGHLDVVTFLHEKGADVNAVGGEYGTALHAAAWRGRLDVVKFLHEKGADVNDVGGEYGTALQAAAWRGHLDVVKFLHEKGADVNAAGEEYGTALQAPAGWRYSIDVVKFLHEKGADVNAMGGFYGTALQAAALRGHLDVVKFLHEKGADVNAVGGEYGTALQAAAYGGHLDVVKFLHEKGADVNAVGGRYGTALQAAAWRGHLDVVKFLHEKGADVNAVGGEYGTALQAAALMGHLDVVKFLHEKGADVNAVGGKYGTALKAAQKGEKHHVAEFLQSKGARG
ncbi:hypothetical protein VKT23_010593 [Stygiomarasmius scandens]|uniref:DUF6535 domain-containing protein n=1 Tax=Marasmiellus scandens TaxID=2682957 RepID=A0ABR1JAR4_9AGAR